MFPLLYMGSVPEIKIDWIEQTVSIAHAAKRTVLPDEI